MSRAAGEAVAGGPYAIGQGSLTANSNYTVAGFTGANFTITPAPLTIRAFDQFKLANGLPFAGPYTIGISGLTNGDDSAALGTIIIGGSALTAVDVGSYRIVPSGAANANYDVSFVDGILAIGALPVEVGTPISPPPQQVTTETTDEIATNSSGGSGCADQSGGESCSTGPYPSNWLPGTGIVFVTE